MDTFEYENTNSVHSMMQKIRAARLVNNLTAEKAEPPKTLRYEIIEWYENLFPWEKEMGWHMDFLVKRFGTCPSLIGPILTGIGFIDKRDWKRGRPYRRFWFGPETKLNDEETQNVKKRY